MSRRHRPGSQPYEPGRRAQHAGLSGLPAFEARREELAAAQSDTALGSLPDRQIGGGGSAGSVDLALGLIPALDDQDLLDLGRLLGDSLNDPRPALTRHKQLGLLIRLAYESQGVVPTTPQYTLAREHANTINGEAWPPASTLITIYGSWISAVRAAANHAFRGTAARVSGYYRGSDGKGSYTLAECVAAVHRCHKALGGTWPTQRTFERYCELERALAARAGQPDPRAPVRKAWQRAAGSWPALEHAAREAATDSTPDAGLVRTGWRVMRGGEQAAGPRPPRSGLTGRIQAVAREAPDAGGVVEARAERQVAGAAEPRSDH